MGVVGMAAADPAYPPFHSAVFMLFALLVVSIGYSAFEPAISATNVVGIVGYERLQLCCGSGKEL